MPVAEVRTICEFASIQLGVERVSHQVQKTHRLIKPVVGLLTLLQCRDTSLVAALAPNFVLLGTRERDGSEFREQVNHRGWGPTNVMPFAPHHYEMLRAPRQDPYVSTQHRAAKYWVITTGHLLVEVSHRRAKSVDELFSCVSNELCGC